MAKGGNNNNQLGLAKSVKNDEFYTQMADIEKELRHYRHHFEGKTVLCNCDDPFESNFFKYFVLNFNKLKLKKLIATCYGTSPVAGEEFRYVENQFGQLSFEFGEEIDDNSYEMRHPYKAVVTSVYDKTGDGGVDLLDVAELFRSGENQLEELTGDGDFRSQECLELMDEADIVVTNPPFSLFREYLTTLIEHEKKFIVIGHINAVKYKEIFPLIKDNKVWLGATNFNGGATYFIGSQELYDPVKMSNPKHAYIKDGKLYWRVNGVRWYTNLDIKKRHEEMILVKHYTPEEYPSYVNFDGIDVNNIKLIPCDYPGNMGVPITIMETFNPDQFELIGTSTGALGRSIGVKPNYRGRTDVSFLDKNGNPQCPFQRFIIRNKRPEKPKGE